MKWLYILVLVKVIIAQQNGIRLPAEWERHERTFMCWPQSAKIWTAELLPEVRKDVARIANAIVRFEPVVMLADPDQVEDAKALLDAAVTVIPIKVDDLWARDTLPVFVEKGSALLAVLFNFNGWGEKQDFDNDENVAGAVAQKYNLESIRAQIVAEGGSFETDGKGTLLVTESSVVNTNRNKISKEEIESALKQLLGVRKVIWFKGVKGQDITDAHVDCLVRFSEPGVVILNRPFPGAAPDLWSESSDDAYNVLQSSTDADGNPFKIIQLFEPNPDKIKVMGNETTFLASYVNFLVGNGFVVFPAFSDVEADAEAQKILQERFPGREVVPVPISALASGGGGIHCATHEQPAVKQEL